MHLNIFFCRLLGGACPQGLYSCLCLPAGECIGQQPTVTVFYELALKINYTAEVRGKTKANPSASGQVDSPMAQRVNALTVASITGTAIAQAPRATIWQPHLEAPG